MYCIYSKILPVFILFFCLLLIPATDAHAQRAVLEEGLFRIEYHLDADDMAKASLAVLQDALVAYDRFLPAGEDTIHVLIAHTLEEFAEHGGWIDQVSISGIAFTGESRIVVKSPRLRLQGGDYPNTLRHELVHILLYRNVDTDLLPRWLNEGISMMLAGDYRWGSTFGVARLFLENRLIPYPELDRTFARRGHDGRFGDAYGQALSMTRFLRKELGDELFWEIILATKEKPFGEALREIGGMSVLELWHRYERSLWQFAITGMFSSGTLFIPAAFLVILVWWKKHLRNRTVLAQWAAEEAEMDNDSALLLWDDAAEDPDAWKEGTEYDNDSLEDER